MTAHTLQYKPIYIQHSNKWLTIRTKHDAFWYWQHTHTSIFRLQYNNIVELVICLLVYTMMVGIRRKHTPNIYDVYNNRSQSSSSLLHQQQIERIACAFCAPRNVNCLHSARSPTCNLIMLHLFAGVCTMFDVLPVILVHFSFVSVSSRAYNVSVGDSIHCWCCCC